MRIKHTYFLLLAFLIPLCWYGCSKPEMVLPQPKKDERGKTYFESKEDLVTWSNNNTGMVRTKKLGEFSFTLKRLSPDMLAMQELRGNISNASEYEEARSHYLDLVYYRLNIQNNTFHKELLKYNLSSGQEYTDRVTYCSFHINKDIYLTNGKDTVACAIHEFERSFNIESGLNFVIAFPVIGLNREHTVVLEDKLFKNGIIKFSFDTNSNDIPYFKIK